MQDYILGKNKLGYLDLWHYLKVKLDYNYTVSVRKKHIFLGEEKKHCSVRKKKHYSGKRNIILGKGKLFWEKRDKKHYSVEKKNIILGRAE